MIEYLQQLDTKWFLFLNGLHNPFWDTVMWHISATITWIPLYLVIIFFTFKKLKKRAFVSLLFFGLLVLLADQSSVHLFKNVFERLRPCHNPEIKDLVHIVNNKCGGSYGFVSSHAANTFALAVFVLFLFKNRITTVAIILWAAIVSYSRIYLGVHFVFDVVCGALLGSIIGYFTFKLHDIAHNYMKIHNILSN